MYTSKYQFFHGWVDEIARNPANRARSRLWVKLADSKVLHLALVRPHSAIKLGDEVSVVVERARPWVVLVLANHTAGDGINYLRGAAGRWPSDLDSVVIAVTAASFAVALEWMAVPALLAFVLLYWLLTSRLPASRRRSAAACIDYAMDREHGRWRAELDRKGGPP